MRNEGEASVEEILESIKKVIARDNRSIAADERRERAERGITAVQALEITDDEDDEVLDLDEMAELADDDDTPAEMPLITEAARSSMRESLEALATISQPGVPPQIVRSGETSLEGLTRELLRPALADWLDKNLPPLVERLVAAEISRIVGKRV